MNVSLTPELEQFILAQVQSGLYHSASEVIRDGLRVLMRVNTPSHDVKTWYNSQIDMALTQAENGETVSAEAVYQRLKHRLDKWDQATH
jgi:antitoxin ParD1/3/4